MATLIPVDFDPFAAPPAQPAAAPRLIPVDHDPFAAAPAPPVSTDNTVGVTPGGVPIAPSGRPRVTIGPEPVNRPASILPSSIGGAVRDFTVGAQGVGKGIADIVTGPFDLVAGAQNLISSGINKVAGTDIPMATPASKLLEQGAEAIGVPGIDTATMSPSEKLAYDTSRFGTQGIGMGTMLAQRAPQIMAQTTPSPTLGGRVADTMARPYAVTPGRAHVGDAVGGAGAGIAVNAADTYVPDDASIGGTLPKQLANTLAPIAGGIGATTIQGAIEGIGGMLKNMAIRATRSAPAPIPVNPDTKVPYSIPEADQAARRFQSAATGDTKLLARTIRENADELQNPTKAGEIPVEKSQVPTTGLLSEDPGLVTLEQGARIKQSPDFIQRDQNVKEGAADRVASVRDPEADLGAVMRRAGEARNERMAPVEQRVGQFEDINNRVTQQRQAEGANYAPIANSEARTQASRRLDKAVVDDNYIPARTEKNRQFDTAPGRTEQLPADDVFAAIDRVRAGINELGPAQQLPAEFVQRLDRLRPRIDPDSGENVGGPGTALGGDLADLRKYLNTAQNNAQQAGNFDLATNIGQLRMSINQTLNEAPGYADANRNYSEFADKFRPGRGDISADLTKKIDRDPTRSTTPPSETAGKFLNSTENAAALQRILADAPNAQAGQTAVRDYLRSSFAEAALNNSDGTLNPARAAAWARNNAEVLAQFPALRTEFDNIAATARRGEQLSKEAQSGLDQARKARNSTEQEVDRSAVGTLLREDPRDVAKKLLNGGYGSEKKLDEIVGMVKNDETAKRGWKAAVAEVLTDKVTSTRQTGETFEVQYARLAKEFKDNEKLLAKTFTPEEMNTLRQGHKMLSYFKEAEKRATTGSQTAERINIPGWAQLVVRHFKGDLAGGGLIKRFKLLLEQLPNNRQGADDITHMAFFDPAVAAYLLERPLPAANTSLYNINLRRLQALANGARESGPDDQE